MVAGEVKGRLDLLFARVAALHASKAGACCLPEHRSMQRLMRLRLLLQGARLIDHNTHIYTYTVRPL